MEFIMKPYRYFTGIKQLKKGRHYIVAHLHSSGKSSAEIITMTGATRDSVEKFTSSYDKGRKQSVEKYFGQALTPETTCELIGAWTASIKSE